MIELQRHIEVLLLENDCVIVPDFGGFMAHAVTARYDEAEQCFLPPLRTLGFNAQLHVNDSLLVQSYIETYDISYPEALRRIESEVEELKATLSNDGYYMLDGLGALSVNAEGNYEFTPCESGVLTPSLYGLGVCTFSRLGVAQPLITPPQVEDAQPETATTVPLQTVLEPATEEPTDADDTIRIKRSWIRNAVAIAAAVILFFCLTTPIANGTMSNVTMSNLRNSMLYKFMPQDSPANAIVATPMTPAAPTLSAEAAEAAVGQPTPDAPAEEAKPEQEAVPLPYTIVLASQVRKSNAERFVSELQQAGYQDARIYIHKGIVRVVCGAFKTSAEAYTRLNALRAHDAFSEAWVYKQPQE